MAKKERIVWIELLRIISCFGVIVLHMGSQYFRNVPVDSYEWGVSNFYHGITRFAVACFLMISGSLYLNEKRSWDFKKVFKSSMSIAVPYVLWQFIYAVHRITLFDKVELSGVEMVKRICIYMTESFTHLWYLPTLLGLVLITPLIWRIVNGADGKKWTEFLLILFVLFRIVPDTVNDFEFQYSEYIMNILNLVKPNMVLGYMGYFVLGHYLNKYGVPKKMEYALYALSVASAGVGIYLCQTVSLQNNRYTQAFYENFTFVVLFMSAGLFLFFRNYISRIKFGDKMKAFISYLGGCTFGIYLVHMLVRNYLKEYGIDALTFDPLIAIPAVSALIFLVSAVFVAIVKKIPVIGKWLV